MRCAYCALFVALGFGCKDKIQEALPASRATLIVATEPQRAEPAPQRAEVAAVAPAPALPAADGGPPDAGPRVMDARLAMPQSTRSPCPYGYRLAAADSCMPSLVRLELPGGALRPAFSTAVTQYEAAIPLTTQNLDLLLTAGLSASVNINHQPVERGRWQSPLLPVGRSSWSIQVSEPGYPDTAYALTIQRGEEDTALQPDKPAASLRFGQALALSGDTLAVGVPGDATDVARSGAVNIYVRSEDGWRRQATLKASNPDPGDAFGMSLALAGDTLLVGASGEDGADNLAADSGAAYVFARKTGSWREQAYLKASHAEAGERFGTSVAIADQTLVVGALGEAGRGSAYVFARRDQRWTQQAQLKANAGDAGDQFGQAVAIDRDIIVVGAWAEASRGRDASDKAAAASGAAYVFARRAGSWFQEAQLKAGNAEAHDQFGRSVAVSGTTCAIGAVGESSQATGVDGNGADNAAAGSGAVYVFTRSNSGWHPEAYLKPSDTRARDAFGQSLALEGDRLLVGVPEHGAGAGGAYLFTRSGSAWTQATGLTARHPMSEAQYGYAVSVSGSALAIGAPGEKHGEDAMLGCAYVLR